MTMSTPTLDEASRVLASATLVDQIQIMNVSEPVTAGTEVTRATTNVGQPVMGLVQTTVLENAIESRVTNTYSVKVARWTALEPGQAVKVLICRSEPSLVGKVLLIDKVSQNGLALIRKGVASDFTEVNQQGKEGL